MPSAIATEFSLLSLLAGTATLQNVTLSFVSVHLNDQSRRPREDIVMLAARDVTAQATFFRSNLLLRVVSGLFYLFDRSDWPSVCIVGKQTLGFRVQHNVPTHAAFASRSLGA